ncbi:hypothetical protein A3751_12655, partial [Oleiphilus sp. HI0080]
GGSSSSSNPASAPTTEIGVFLDEAVANIGYRTETLEGVTDSQGQYDYVEGETVTFFIGDLEFPPVTASGVVTPLDMAGTEDTSDPTVVNIIRLLQSIDEDGDPDNGITITETAKNNATQVNFDVSVSDFSSSAAVTTFIANSGSVNTTLISESEAIAHFEGTLIDEGEVFVPSNSIAGVWVNEETTNELLAFVFFEDGTYVHMEIDEVAPLNPDNPNEVSGMEWGTYSIDPETRELTASITFDGNFDTGLTDSIGQVDIFARVDGNTLTIQVDDNDSGTIEEGEATDFTRSSNAGILGAWTNTETTNELLAFVFFDNGTYAHLEIDEVAPLNPENPNEVSGMEWGTYSINPQTGELTASITFDGNDDTGLTDSIGQVDIFAQVAGDTLTIEVDDNNNGSISEDEQFNFERAPMPSYEPILIEVAWVETLTNYSQGEFFSLNGGSSTMQCDAGRDRQVGDIETATVELVRQGNTVTATVLDSNNNAEEEDLGESWTYSFNLATTTLSNSETYTDEDPTGQEGDIFSDYWELEESYQWNPDTGVFEGIYIDNNDLSWSLDNSVSSCRRTFSIVMTPTSSQSKVNAFLGL